MTPTPIDAGAASPLVAAVATALLHSVGQSTVVAAGAALALHALRRAAPSIRFVVAYGALLLTVIVPLVSTAGAPWAVRSWAVEVAWPLPTMLRTVGAHLALWQPWIVAAWCAGVFVQGGRLAGGWVVLQWRDLQGTRPLEPAWQRRAERLAARLGIRHAVRLVHAPRVDVPCTVGWWQPLVILPVGTLAGLTVAQCEAIIAHELAHVRRRDYLLNMGQLAIEALLFYHPAVRWLSRRVDHEREFCCDALAVATCGDAVGYADALVSLETSRPPRSAHVVAATSGDLLARITRVVAEPRPATSAGVAAISAVMAATGIGVALLVFASLPFSHGAATPLAAPLPPGVALGALLGLVVGLRHALEPDHLMTVATFVTSERGGVSAARRLGLSWGIGHTAALLVAGTMLMVVRSGMPEGVTRTLEFAVAAALIALGIRNVREGLRLGSGGPATEHVHGPRSHRHAGPAHHLHVGTLTFARGPLLLGVLHGLAGSGALTALAVATLPTVAAQLAFLVVFGAGSTTAMALLSGCAGWPLARLAQSPAALAVLTLATGVISIAAGVSWGVPLLEQGP